MINYFPTLYEDELFFSAISRYRQMCGMVSKKALRRELFNEEFIIMSPFFPQKLDSFVNNLPPSSTMTSDEIIWNHTLFPFFSSFLTEEKKIQVISRMKNSKGVCIESLLGISGSPIKTNQKLKYCPICYRNDLDSNGESYWRRLHQIPQIYYCLEHDVLLKTSPILCVDSKTTYHCADDEICSDEILEDNFPSEYKRLNIEYAKIADILLNNKYQGKEKNFFIDYYVDRLQEIQLISKDGRVKSKELGVKFLDFFSSEYLGFMKSDLDLNNRTNWLRRFLRKEGCNKSPIRHILFLQFLGIEVGELFQANEAIGRIHNSTSKKRGRRKHISLIEKRKQWISLIENNPGATRTELSKLSKGNFTWLTLHDRNWFEKVTPKVAKRKSSIPTDWETKDKESLEMAMEAVRKILEVNGKPLRVCPANIRRYSEARNWFYNEKLIRTKKYITEVTEDIECYRIRKIKWAINEMKQKKMRISPYRVRLYAGFGGVGKDVRELINEILNEFEGEKQHSYSE
ncbi:TnsD family Tn7-like transposition protein [Schinkia azotoformans]|uniref:TnsD family Tn7-like transposition protein n=1 Tax=Schinkia azotoformans TaxID=1454 RepID=UPI002DB9D3D7|nr:TnsD family Tn7-like transposition protein [Schinkia azotoformans]MEC1759897.1 TnsD family Tn7-like transposition protein [Schinkia azotoformans]